MAYRDTLEKVYAVCSEMAEEYRARGATAEAAFNGAAFNGYKISNMAHNSRFLGIAEYVLSSDIDSLRRNLSTSARLTKLKYIKHDNGEGVDGAFVCMSNNYTCLTNALAAGDYMLAQDCARVLGGRDQIEEVVDSEFIRALGYMMKSAVLDDGGLFDEWSPVVEAACEDKYYAFEGHFDVCKAFREGDRAGVVDGVEKMSKLHVAMCKRGGFYHDTEDELLSIDGIGFANLGRFRGIAVPGFPPFVPKDLLVEVHAV